jgi:predicted 2-oxoglutarate/Fe(II)-dependent dioxygenase YbiX
MNNNVEYDYWFWDNILTKEKIKNLNNFIDKNFDCFQDKEEGAKDRDGKYKKEANVKCIKYGKIKDYIKELEYNFIGINNKHFGFELHPHLDFDYVNFNTYSFENAGNYDWHTDNDYNNYQSVKLTVLVNLSTKIYSGGEFLIFNGGEYQVKELNKPGNMIMFRSYLSHKVTPITSGERKTLAIFLKGPKFK